MHWTLYGNIVKVPSNLTWCVIHMLKITNLWKFWLNLSSKLQGNIQEKKLLLHNVCAFRSLFNFELEFTSFSQPFKLPITLQCSLLSKFFLKTRLLLLTQSAVLFAYHVIFFTYFASSTLELFWALTEEILTVRKAGSTVGAWAVLTGTRLD